ncbi:ATP-binding cassette domain-containing protein [Levilactobacillus namurensis]|uniref:ATP-binding cassette domain-containing protein n=1 Tax=Levilactobacillus namurensis TaxID=380393 RepID=A0AAW8W4K3_9LACO|nr:ATP-binding cassette domain-containing protein [Levilactobacillus namurensis]MDT7013510.1 ATP-binding cassette domain-containing protein [Levilactobacillus namurensis]
MGTIQIQHLSFQYPGATHPLFTDLSTNFDSHWKLGLIGRNGRGKTTFLNLLRGQLTGTGTITAPVTFNYFPAENIDPTLTVMQLMTATGAADWQATIELTKIGLPPAWVTRQFGSLSGGEQTKVLLARGFVDDTAFPLIDEPTNHLDLAGRTVVGQYLRHKRGFICISHDEHFLNLFVDHVMAITPDRVHIVAGTVAAWRADKARQDQAATAKNAQLITDIHHLTRRANTQRGWSERRERETHDAGSRRSAAKLMRRAKVFEQRTADRIAERQGLLADLETTTPLTTNATPGQGHRLLLSARQFSLLRAAVPLFDPLEIDFHQGDQLAILGPNGSGKTSLIATLLGHTSLEHTGYLQNDLPANVGYLAQDFHHVIRNVDWSELKANHQLTTVWNLMHQLGVSRSRLRAPASEWSMGEAKKAALALTLCRPHDLLVWDEPTNYLDLPARDQLATLVQAVRPTLLMIDHDAQFVTTTCPHQLTLTPYQH